MNENKSRDYFKEEISFDNYSTYRNDVNLNNQITDDEIWGKAPAYMKNI